LLINKEKKFVKITVNFKKLMNNYIFNSKIDILRCGQKKIISLYIVIDDTETFNLSLNWI